MPTILYKFPGHINGLKFSLKVWVASMLMYPLYIEIALVVEKRWARLAALTVFLFSTLFLAMVYFMWGWLA